MGVAEVDVDSFKRALLKGPQGVHDRQGVPDVWKKDIHTLITNVEMQ
jgi:hypothetical protein